MFQFTPSTPFHLLHCLYKRMNNIAYKTARRPCLKCDGTRAETTFHIFAKRTSPFTWAGSVRSVTAGSRGVPISGSNAGYTVF